MQILEWLVIMIASACGGGDKKETVAPTKQVTGGSPAPDETIPYIGITVTGRALEPAPRWIPHVLPRGIRSLVPDTPLPSVGAGEVLLLAAKPGGWVRMIAPDSRRHLVREGVIGTGDDATIGDQLAFDEHDRAVIVEATGNAPHTAQVVTRAHDQGDLPHQEVWFVPTVGTRVLLAADATTVDVFWGLPKEVIVILDETAWVVDPASGAAVQIAESAGSPSYSPDGKLYYRTLDGGAWRLTGMISMGSAHSEQVGKGRRGTAAKGDLNVGFDRAIYPPAVTFDKAGNPKFK